MISNTAASKKMQRQIHGKKRYFDCQKCWHCGLLSHRKSAGTGCEISPSLMPPFEGAPGENKIDHLIRLQTATMRNQQTLFDAVQGVRAQVDSMSLINKRDDGLVSRLPQCILLTNFVGCESIQRAQECICQAHVDSHAQRKRHSWSRRFRGLHFQLWYWFVLQLVLPYFLRTLHS